MRFYRRALCLSASCLTQLCPKTTCRWKDPFRLPPAVEAESQMSRHVLCALRNGQAPLTAGDKNCYLICSGLCSQQTTIRLRLALLSSTPCLIAEHIGVVRPRILPSSVVTFPLIATSVNPVQSADAVCMFVSMRSPYSSASPQIGFWLLRLLHSWRGTRLSQPL